MKTVPSHIIAFFMAVFLQGVTGCHRIDSFPAVYALLETHAVDAPTTMDAADDPAIWVHPRDPARSLVIGTNKVAGLSVYNLSGVEIHFYPLGRVNNVDLRYGFLFGDGSRGDIVACTERIRNEILLLRIDPSDGSLEPVLQNRLISGEPEIYGCCMYMSPDSRQYYALSNSKNGTIEQWLLEPAGQSQILGRLVRKLKVRGQPEGMVADDELGQLYVGEERKGIWKFQADPTNTPAAGEDLMDPVQPVFIEDSHRSNPAIAYDIEGLSIYYAAGGMGYLVASSQGNNSYAVFGRQGENPYLGSFSIGDQQIDGCSDTDGIDVCNLALGYLFGGGVFVAQDGTNTDQHKLLPQNFKLVCWEEIAGLFDPPLTIDTTYREYHPRR